jgi:hypothetical protein
MEHPSVVSALGEGGPPAYTLSWNLGGRGMARIFAGLTFTVLALALMSVGHAQQISRTSSPAEKQKLVVVAGTQIKVDVSEENPPRNVASRTFPGKVTNIVQVNTEVAIPAGSKVTVRVSGRHYDSGYQEVMELLGVTLDDVRYDLQTDQVPVIAGSMSEATFTLTKDLTIER